LSIDEQRDFAILQEDYKNQMRKYKKKSTFWRIWIFLE
jgi:hypothetical protein